MYKFFSQIGTILLASICVFNIPVESGINKKNFKSKTVHQLIDLLGDDELLEKKVTKLVNKSNLNLMCKLHLYSLPMEVSWRKQTMIDTKNDKNIPKQYKNQVMQEVLVANNEMTNRQLGFIDLYCD